MIRAALTLAMNIIIVLGFMFSAVWVPQTWLSLVLIVGAVASGFLLHYTMTTLLDEIWWSKETAGHDE